MGSGVMAAARLRAATHAAWAAVVGTEVAGIGSPLVRAAGPLAWGGLAIAAFAVQRRRRAR